MLLQEVQFLAELGHFLRENGEDVLFFDGVVEVELGAEGEAGEDELAGVFLFAGGGTGVLEVVPDEAEVVVLGLVNRRFVRSRWMYSRTGPFVRTSGCRLESLSSIVEGAIRPLLCHCQLLWSRSFSSP